MLYDDVGIARDEPLHVIGGKPCVQIVRAAGRMSEQDRDGLALVELRRRLRRRRRHHDTERKRHCSDRRATHQLGCQDQTVLPRASAFRSPTTMDRFVQSMSELSYMSLMLICCGLTSVVCNQGTNEPHMARKLDVAKKCPSNDTNAFDGRKPRASEFIC